VPIGSKTFPLDWSLKTKVRFVTESSLTWCGLLRSTEESHGSDSFTKCSPLATSAQLQVSVSLEMGSLFIFCVDRDFQLMIIIISDELACSFLRT